MKKTSSNVQKILSMVILLISLIGSMQPFQIVTAQDSGQDEVISLSDPVVETDQFAVYGGTMGEDYSIATIDMIKSEDFKIDEQEEVWLEGVLSEVCQSRGCNLVIDDGTHQVRVRFKDYEFFVPTDSAGKKGMVRGKFVLRNGEEGETPEIEFLASAIKVYR